MSTTSASTSNSSSSSSSTSTSRTTVTMPPLEPSPPANMIRLNRSGDSPDNPILAGIHFRIRHHKHSSGQGLRRCWVTRDGEVFRDLTARCVETESEIYVDVVAGTDLEADFPALLNTVNLTTSDEVQVRYGVWVAEVPPHVILLDGYDGQDPTKPIVIPFRWTTE